MRSNQKKNIGHKCNPTSLLQLINFYLYFSKVCYCFAQSSAGQGRKSLRRSVTVPQKMFGDARTEASGDKLNNVVISANPLYRWQFLPETGKTTTNYGHVTTGHCSQL